MFDDRLSHWILRREAHDAVIREGGPKRDIFSGRNVVAELLIAEEITRYAYYKYLAQRKIPLEAKAAKAIEIFCSYAHKDDRLRIELLKQLKPLMRDGLINTWLDREILGGTEFRLEIDAHLNTANMILLLISPDFISSDYCYEIEMKRALERHYIGAARVIPIILRPCMWERTPFGQLQALPQGGKAVTTWSNQDKAFLDIAEGIQKAAERLKRNS